MPSSPNVIVITGANSGVGLALAKRLAQDAADNSKELVLCLACRNMSRAEEAKRLILSGCGAVSSVSVEIVQLDTSSLSSVARAAKQLKEQFGEIHTLVLNAGILTANGFTLRNVLKRRTIEGASCYLSQVDGVTSDGLRQVFCTNVFGHYCLVQLLRDHIKSQARPCHVIWCSSRSASSQFFSFDDVQHNLGVDPYASSKYAMDVISVAINETLQEEGIFSDVACPGLVMSPLTWGILPGFVWYFILPILYLLRLFLPMFTIHASHGAVSLAWLCNQRPQELNHRVKYISMAHLGETTVGQQTMNISTENALKLGHKLHRLMDEHQHQLLA